jgi:hypothetical protein
MTCVLVGYAGRQNGGGGLGCVGGGVGEKKRAECSGLGDGWAALGSRARARMHTHLHKAGPEGDFGLGCPQVALGHRLLHLGRVQGPDFDRVVHARRRKAVSQHVEVLQAYARTHTNSTPVPVLRWPTHKQGHKDQGPTQQPPTDKRCSQWDGVRCPEDPPPPPPLTRTLPSTAACTRMHMRGDGGGDTTQGTRQGRTALRASSRWPLSPENTATHTRVEAFHSRRLSSLDTDSNRLGFTG